MEGGHTYVYVLVVLAKKLRRSGKLHCLVWSPSLTQILLNPVTAEQKCCWKTAYHTIRYTIPYGLN